MFKIGRHDFKIARTEFRARIVISESGWSPSYFLEIECEPLETEGCIWEAKLSTQADLILPSPSQLAGSKFGPLTDDEWGEPVFLLYMFSHEPIYHPRIEFSKAARNEFYFELTGTTPNWDEAIDTETVSIKIKCTLPFSGVTVDEPDVNRARKIINQSFRNTEWQEPELNRNGHLFKLR